MKATRRWLIVEWSILPVLAVLFIVAGIVHERELAPPAGVRTLAEFAAKMPAPQRLTVGGDDGKSLIWTGEVAGFPALPSGPACYRFDQQGRLVEWCTETGDGQSLDRFVGWGTEISLEEALERTRNAN